MIPRQIKGAMAADLWIEESTNPAAQAYRGYRKGNQIVKSMLLGLSPKWILGNLLGMTLAANVHGGIGPGEFFSQMGANVRAQGGLGEAIHNEGLLSELPGQLSTSGLTRNEFKVKFEQKAKELSRGTYNPLRVTDKIQGVIYPANEIYDNLAKSTVYLSKLRRGESRESALKSTLDAMGNYNSMNSFERKVVREIFPFYAWMRQSTKAALTLPLNSPMRAAMVYSMGTAMTDPDVTPEVQQLIGSRFRLGRGINTFLDFGSFNPNANLTDQGITAFDPRTIGSSLSPLAKFGIQALTGVDPNTWTQQTRPADTAMTGLQGQPAPGPSWAQLLKGNVPGFVKETAYQLHNLTPQTKGLSELAFYGNTPRYAGTGYPYAGTPNPNITTPRSILRALQLPGPYTIDVPAVRKKTDAAAGKG